MGQTLLFNKKPQLIFLKNSQFHKIVLTGFSTVMILYFRICVMAHFRNLTIFIEEKAPN